MKDIRKNKYFDLIQIFRGMAALMVVIHHAYGSFIYFHYIDISFLKYIASIEKYRVDFFFVLSGFIITYTCYKYGNKVKEIKKYLFNRFVRIYIPYWPVSILMIGLYLHFSSFSHGNRIISWVMSLLLYPDGSPALSVAWTLVYEILFYILFIIFFISRKAWNWFVVVWLLVILYYSAHPLSFNNALFYTFTNSYNLEFILGYTLASVLKKGFRIYYFISLLVTAFCLGLFLYLTYFNVKTIPFFNNIVFAFAGTFLIILGVCNWDRKIGNHNLFMLMGNATYSIYLVHNPLQAFLIRLLPISNHNYLLFYCEFIFLIMVCCVFGFLYYLLIEKVMITKIKKRFLAER